MAITPNTIFSAGAILTANQMNRLPWGILGRVQSTTSFNTVATHTTYQDDGLSVSVNYSANRIIRVTWQTTVYTAGGANTIGAKAVFGSTDLIDWSFPQEALSNTFGLSVCETVTFVGPATAGTATFKIQIRAATNNTRVDEFASVTGPRQLIVEDLGGA